MGASTRRRLLFLLPFAPRLEGTHGGAKATGNLIAALARRHQVRVLHLRENGESAADRELAEACEDIEAIEREPRATSLRARLALRLSPLRGVPIWAAEIAEPRFDRRLAELVAEWEPDLVQVEYPVMGQYLGALESCRAPRVLVDHDPRAPGLRTWPGLLGGVTRLLDKRAWKPFKRRVLRSVDRVVVFTAADRSAIEALSPGTRVVEAPIGVALPEAPLDPIGATPPNVLFVGNFTHAPNSDGARWLAERIFPAVRAERPDARLVIVGPEPPAALRELAGEGIEVTGEVPAVTPYLEGAAVVVAPIRTGGGMRVKVMEALASGKAVVATPLAVEGLQVDSGDQLLVAGDEQEFRAAVLELLRDDEARRSLGHRAHEWAKASLGWDAAARRYEELYAELTRGRGSQG